MEPTKLIMLGAGIERLHRSSVIITPFLPTAAGFIDSPSYGRRAAQHTRNQRARRYPVGRTAGPNVSGTRRAGDNQTREDARGVFRRTQRSGKVTCSGPIEMGNAFPRLQSPPAVHQGDGRSQTAAADISPGNDGDRFLYAHQLSEVGT